jgi:hypothetical protein
VTSKDINYSVFEFALIRAEGRKRSTGKIGMKRKHGGSLVKFLKNGAARTRRQMLSNGDEKTKEKDEGCQRHPKNE